MAQYAGTVKFFNRVKGYGFIVPDGGGKDVFIHFSDAKHSGVYPIKDGMRLIFETAADGERDAQKAVNLRPFPEVELIALPKQGLGPHFCIDDEALLNFDVPPVLDSAGNNIARLRSLQPLIADASRQLVDKIRSNEQPQLRTIANDYLRIVDQDVEEIDYNRLYGVGLRLENALTAAKRQIENRLLPPLEDDAAEALDSVLALHGPFILSTSAGNELLADSERYLRRPKEEVAIREAAFELSRELENDSEVANPEVGEFIRSIADTETDSDHPERIAAYSDSAIKNVSIIIIASATVATAASFPFVGNALLSLTAVVGALSLLLGRDALKKTRLYVELQNQITGAIDRATDSLDLATFANRLKPFKKFVLRNENLLRRLAGDNQGLNWIHRYLDWIKQQDSRYL